MGSKEDNVRALVSKALGICKDSNLKVCGGKCGAADVLHHIRTLNVKSMHG